MSERIIGEYKQAQEALREAEERFRSAFSYAVIGMALVDIDGRWLQVNRSLCEILGYSEQELLDKTFQDITHPDDLEADLGYVRQLLSGEIRTYQMEKRYFHKEGHTVSALLSVSLVRDTTGNPLYFISQIQDITERKRAEEELGATTSQLAALIENLPAGILVEDDSRRVAHVNQEFCTMFGIPAPPQALIGADCSRSAEEVKDLFAEPERFGERIVELLHERRVVTGEELYLADRRVFERDYVPIFVDEIYRGHLWHYRDITERKQAEHVLREAEAKYRTLVEQLPAITYINTHTQTSDNLYVSPQIESILGISAAQWMADPQFWVTLLHPDDRERVVAEVARSYITGEPLVSEYRMYARDGRVVWFHDKATTVRDDAGQIYFHQGVMLDITERKHAEEALRQAEERFRSLVQNVSDIITVIEADGTIRYVSPSVERVLGYKPEDRIGSTPFESMYPDDAERARSLFAEVLQSPGSTFLFEAQTRHRDGSWRHIEATGVNLLDDPSVGAIVVNSRDITERKQAEKALSESERRYRSVVDNVKEAIFQTDAQGLWTFLNRAWTEITGFSVEESIGTNFLDYVHPDDRQRSLELFRPLIERKKDYCRHEIRYLTKDGDFRWIEVWARLTLSEDDAIVGTSGTLNDITDRKALEERLTHQAFHDSLTNLPNRSLFMDRLRHALASAKRRQDKVAVLFMDLDDFKVINDSLGHKVGDQLLVAVTKRLKACLRPADTMARLSGDELAVLLEDVGGVSYATQVAERVTRELRAPHAVGGHEVFVTVSIGIALSSSAQDRPEDLLRNADLAMYRAKSRGKAHYEVFDPSMSTRALKRLELGNDLRRALEQDELRVCYQPKVRLDTSLQQYLRASGSRAIVKPKVTEPPRTVGMEALVRWEHPKRGLLSPSEFIPIAEETGLVLSIGQRVLEEAGRQGRAWQEQYPSDPPLMISVNLSSRQFQHPELTQDVARILQETGLAPQSLCLEITESVVMEDAPSTIDTLKELKDLGIQLAVDDFGTGYSSLSYLKRFPIDYLKIDRSFVDQLGKDPEDAILVSGIITLAHTLGMQVIAEGVETAEQLTRLRALGCDLAQGNYFSKPLVGEAASELLANEIRLRGCR